ncbi:MAG: aldo/keto reductase [Pseudomonadota bacterium]
MKLRQIGDTGVMVPPLCFGTSGLGNMPATYGYEVGEARAIDTIKTILTGPAPFLDTSRIYGHGRSEARVGAAIKALGGLPEGAVISTKLDRDFETNRFDAARARASLEESLEAMGIEAVGVLHLHDPEYAHDLDEVTGKGGALEALFELKEAGLAKSVGLAMGRVDMMFPILRAWPFDALISHNRFTLLNRSADAMFDYAADNKIAVLNAAPYASGVLAKGADAMPLIAYQKADEAALVPVRRMEAICARHGGFVGPAALQFSMRDPRIVSTIVGVTRPERVKETLDWAAQEIPEEAWQELRALPFSMDDPEANRDYVAE